MLHGQANRHTTKRTTTAKSFVRENLSSETKLDRAYKMAQIIALLAMPLVVGLIGWWTQKSITETAAQKDYVQLAIGLLKEPASSENAELRKWATDMTRKFSPVPFSDKATVQLSRSAVAMLSTNPLLSPALQRRPECTSVPLDSVPDELRASIADLESACRKNYRDLFWLQIYLGMVFKPDRANDDSPHR